LPVICSWPQSPEELFFIAPQADFPLTPAQLQDIVSTRTELTVAELNGRAVAFADFYVWGEDACTIGNVIVSDTVRGQGIGRKLIQRMIAVAFANYAASEVRVSCFNHNVAGLLFYPKSGFEPYAIEQRQDKRGNHVALVHLRLAKPASKIGRYTDL